MINFKFGEGNRHTSPESTESQTPIHNIIKMQKCKDREWILKVAREKQLVTYKGAPIRLPADFSTEPLQARKDCHEIIQVMKSKDLQPKLPTKVII